MTTENRAGGVAMTFDLAALKAKSLPRCTFDALGVKLVPKDGAAPEQVEKEITEIRSWVDIQVARFIPPQKECIGCGRVIAAANVLEAFALATFTYGLAHGEGSCSNCGYPARANHYPIGDAPGLRFDRVLQYHPDELEERQSAPTRGLCERCASGRHLCADEHCPCAPCTAEATGVGAVSR